MRNRVKGFFQVEEHRTYRITLIQEFKPSCCGDNQGRFCGIRGTKTKLKGRNKVVGLTKIEKPIENVTFENLTDKREK